MTSAKTIFPLLLNLLPIILFGSAIVWVIRFLIRRRQDSQRLRMEIAKLADEVQQIRKQVKDKQSGNSD
jgi:hypothetical protein